MFSKTFRKHGVVPLPTYKWIYKKGDIVDIQGLGTYKKERPTNVTMAKLGESTMLPSMLWHHCKQTRARFLPREWTCLWSILSVLKSWDSFLKRAKEKDQKKKDAKEKGAWVQLKCQPAPPWEARFVRVNEKEPQLLEPVPYEPSLRSLCLNIYPSFFFVPYMCVCVISCVWSVVSDSLPHHGL